MQTKENAVWIAPYEAKNIYMMLYNNSGKGWNLEQRPMVYLFNEYFGTGMNSIVFQELRETRGLAYSASARYNTPSRVGENGVATSQYHQSERQDDGLCARL